MSARSIFKPEDQHGGDIVPDDGCEAGRVSDFRPTVPASAWERLEASKAEHWARRKRELGPGEGLRIAADLSSFLRRARPDWPGEEERAADLATHVRVGEQLRRVR